MGNGWPFLGAERSQVSKNGAVRTIKTPRQACAVIHVENRCHTQQIYTQSPARKSDRLRKALRIDLKWRFYESDSPDFGPDRCDTGGCR